MDFGAAEGEVLRGVPERISRTRQGLLGVTNRDAILHVCGGHAKAYPNKRIVGVQDYTLDLDPATNPTYLRDAREPFPEYTVCDRWPAILCDPPYTEVDAAKYVPGAETFPTANLVLKHAINAVRVGGRVGMLHYLLPQPPKTAKFIACVGVVVGYNNRMRVYSVFERLE